MLDKWYRNVRIKMSMAQFHQLPHNAAYKYEYLDGQALLSPRPKSFNALLELQPRSAPAQPLLPEPVQIRALEDTDWERLARLFAAAFHRVQPFAGLDENERLQASRECLDQTRSGGDGPLVTPACFVATGADGGPLGAILVTLIPKREVGDWWDGRWPEPPPADALERRLGRPHLTWIFVTPWFAFHGLGSTLLAHAGNALLGLGYTELATTFLAGNDSSTLWHWRNGFRLVPYPGSPRVWRQQHAQG